MKSKRMATIGLGVGLAVGAGAGLVMTVPGGAGATVLPEWVSQDDGTTTDDTTTDDTTTDDTTTDDTTTDDTTTERHRGRHGRHGRLMRGLSTAAETIGITEEELASALRDGQTIAEVAEANSVDPQTVIDALVAEAETRITTMVNEGLFPHRDSSADSTEDSTEDPTADSTP